MSAGPGFYRGTTHDQMPFFADKEKKMIESKRWPPEFEKKIDMTKVRLEVMKPWIAKRITELLGYEDDIVIDFCVQQLFEYTDADGNTSEICPKKLQINLTGFMDKKASVFVKELWNLLVSAQENADGVPQLFLEEKKAEIDAKKEQVDKIRMELERVKEATEQRTGYTSSLLRMPIPSETKILQAAAAAGATDHGIGKSISKDLTQKKRDTSMGRSIDVRDDRKHKHTRGYRRSRSSRRVSQTRRQRPIKRCDRSRSSSIVSSSSRSVSKDRKRAGSGKVDRQRNRRSYSRDGSSSPVRKPSSPNRDVRRNRSPPYNVRNRRQDSYRQRHRSSSRQRYKAEEPWFFRYAQRRIQLNNRNTDYGNRRSREKGRSSWNYQENLGGMDGNARLNRRDHSGAARRQSPPPRRISGENPVNRTNSHSLSPTCRDVSVGKKDSYRKGSAQMLIKGTADESPASSRSHSVVSSQDSVSAGSNSPVNDSTVPPDSASVSSTDKHIAKAIVPEHDTGKKDIVTCDRRRKRDASFSKNSCTSDDRVSIPRKGTSVKGSKIASSPQYRREQIETSTEFDRRRNSPSGVKKRRSIDSHREVYDDMDRGYERRNQRYRPPVKREGEKELDWNRKRRLVGSHNESYSYPEGSRNSVGRGERSRYEPQNVEADGSTRSRFARRRSSDIRLTECVSIDKKRSDEDDEDSVDAMSLANRRTMHADEYDECGTLSYSAGKQKSPTASNRRLDGVDSDERRHRDEKTVIASIDQDSEDTSPVAVDRFRSFEERNEKATSNVTVRSKDCSRKRPSDNSAGENNYRKSSFGDVQQVSSKRHAREDRQTGSGDFKTQDVQELRRKALAVVSKRQVHPKRETEKTLINADENLVGKSRSKIDLGNAIENNVRHRSSSRTSNDRVPRRRRVTKSRSNSRGSRRFVKRPSSSDDDDASAEEESQDRKPSPDDRRKNGAIQRELSSSSSAEESNEDEPSVSKRTNLKALRERARVYIKKSSAKT